jgi:2-oxoisovalerate dehydrogenase E1 component
VSGVTGIDHAAADVHRQLQLYRVMREIRSFEEKVGEMFRGGEIPGFVHLSIGQEAVAAGACSVLRPEDGIVSTHRGHGHCIAKGAPVSGMLAELMARRTGLCGGNGGSMHIADPSRGIFGANGIVGAGLPIAVGVAAAARVRGSDDVMVAFFGDGSVATGAFHEAVNLAALWRLPVVFLCENNHFAEFSHHAEAHPVDVLQRARGYGIDAVSVDGNDVVKVADTIADAVAACRLGEGPILVEAVTYRVHGHVEGDVAEYRDVDELARWLEHDPLVLGARALDAAGAGAARRQVEEAVAQALEDAYREAAAAPPPAVDDLPGMVVRPYRADLVELEGQPPADYRLREAVNDALRDALDDDDDVWFAGIDITKGNVFGVTRGLGERFPDRVLDTPISETAIVGLAVGGAMAGTKPVVEIMYLDFIGVCFDQILNQAAKLPFMTGGGAEMSLVLRTQFGAGRSSGSQHSQSLEAMLAHIPGLTVVMPSTPEDAYGLLRTAIEDPNPVIFIEHRGLYNRKGRRPPPGHRVPIGKAAIRREGADVTIVSWSRSTFDALAAAEELAEAGVDAEVIELRTILPYDEASVAASVAKTNRLVVVHEAVGSGGFGAEVAARVADSEFWQLDAPVVRVAAEFMPAPYAPELERHWLPQREQIVAAVERVVHERA